MANAVIIILYKQNKVLLQRRDEHAPKYPNVWGLISGAIEQGESPKQALLRELKEELNYEIKTPNLFKIVERVNDGKKHYFDAKYNGAELHLREGDGIVWWPVEDAVKFKMIPHHKKALRLWAQKRQLVMKSTKISPPP